MTDSRELLLIGHKLNTVALALIIIAQTADKLIRTRWQPLYLGPTVQFWPLGGSTDMAAIFVQVKGLNQGDFKN